MRGHRDAVWSISIDKAMQRLYSGSRDFTIRAWAADPVSSFDILSTSKECTFACVRIPCLCGGARCGGNRTSPPAPTAPAPSNGETTPPVTPYTRSRNNEKIPPRSIWIFRAPICPRDARGLILAHALPLPLLRPPFPHRVQKSPRTLLGQQLGEHAQAIKAIALSPDNRRLYTASEDATIRVWSTETGAHVQTYTGHTEWVGTIAVRERSSLRSAPRRA